MSPLRGENPIFGPLSKNNIGMAVLRAGMSVKKTSHFFVLSRRATHDPTILGMVIEDVCTVFAPSYLFDPSSNFAARGY